MFERYNLDAQKIMTLAESLAFSYSHEEITKLHLLTAFLKTPESELGQIAAEAGLDIYRLEKKLFHAGEEPFAERSLYMEYSEDLKAVIDQALITSQKQKDSLVTPWTLAFTLIGAFKDEELKDLGLGDKQLLLFALKKKYKRSAELDKIADLHRMGEKKLDPLVGRADILRQLTLVLKRRNKPNPILVGEPGVGKSFIVEHLAQLIKAGEIPELKEKCIFELDLASTVGGTKYRGEFEEKIKKIIKKVMDDGSVILFIDEIHNIVKAGGAEGAIDCSNILKPYLSRGEIQVIGATTYDEYERIFSEDKALKRRFQLIKVAENSEEETEEILERLAPIYGSHYHRQVPSELLPVIVGYAKRYLPNLAFPDKAIDILDNSLAGSTGPALTLVDVSATLESFFHIRVDREFSPSAVIEQIKRRVKGQEAALEELQKDLELLKLQENKVAVKPLGIYLFVGPSGVGKGLTAKLLSDAYYGDKEAFLKVDLTNFKDPASISRLLGSSPGYIGYKDESPLLKQLKKTPRSLILLDEIEKAHPAVLDIFLSAFEDGYFLTAAGGRVDCTSAIFILTSNLTFGQADFFFSRLSQSRPDKKKIEKELASIFKYEFLARLDDIIIFSSLEEEAVKVIEREILKELGATFELADEPLADEYRSEIKKYGARAVIRHAKETYLNGNSSHQP